MKKPRVKASTTSGLARVKAGQALSVCGLLLAALLIYTFWDLPTTDALADHLELPSVRITDLNGRLLYDILPEQGGRHAVISFERIPQCMKDATIAVEDKSFYENTGVDPAAILRSLWLNIRGGGIVAGGSTITQQVARNLLLSTHERNEISLRRKLREAVLAWELTARLSKDDILALYLNQVNYGGMAYGAGAVAARSHGAKELVVDFGALGVWVWNAGSWDQISGVNPD